MALDNRSRAIARILDPATLIVELAAPVPEFTLEEDEGLEGSGADSPRYSHPLGPPLRLRPRLCSFLVPYVNTFCMFVFLAFRYSVPWHPRHRTCGYVFCYLLQHCCFGLFGVFSMEDHMRKIRSYS